MCFERFAPLEFVIWGATYLIPMNNKITTDTVWGERGLPVSYALQRQRHLSLFSRCCCCAPFSFPHIASDAPGGRTDKRRWRYRICYPKEGGMLRWFPLFFSSNTHLFTIPSTPLHHFSLGTSSRRMTALSFLSSLFSLSLNSLDWFVFLFFIVFFYFLPLSSSGKPTWLCFNFYPLISKRT